MKAKNFLPRCVLIILFACLVQIAYSQPRGFSYQAVARDVNNQPIQNTTMMGTFSLYDESDQLIWSEQQEVVSNALGLIQAVIFNDNSLRINGSATQLTDIPWSSASLELQVELEYNGQTSNMGRSPLMAVPYALFALNGTGESAWSREGQNLVYVNGNVGVGTISPEGRLTVSGIDESADEPLFMVTRKDGYPVFAVYEHGVYAFTDTVDSGKGIKGGFAVGGYNNPGKGIGDEYMRVTADSIRFYINQDPAGKGIKGGFAVGGYNNPGKGIGDEFLRVTPDSIRMYINDDPALKGIKGGFAVGGYNTTKAPGAEYFNISGSNNADIIQRSESRILWYPRKEAFMAGRVQVTSPDSVGTNSFSTGFESKAKGDWSQAFGFKSVASGNYSTAIGLSAKASGPSSFAFGGNARASNGESFAFGREAEASGQGSFAMGFDALSSGESAYAFGAGTVSSGLGSFALGFVGRDSSNTLTGKTTATGNFSVAIGMGSVASNKGSFSIGTQTTSDGPYSYAIGYRTTSSGWYSLATGYSTKALGNFSTAMGYGSVASEGHAVAIGQKAAAENWYALALGLNTRAQGQQSIAMGAETTAGGDFSLAIGKLAQAPGLGSISIGFNTTAGDYGVSVGYESNAEASYSTSLGYRTHSSASYAFSAGYLSKAGGTGSVALGSNTNASGGSSITAGQQTIASGIASGAFGISSEATGNYAFAMGQQAIASGDWSFAAGQYTKATAWNTVAMGGGTRASGIVSSAFGLGTIAKPFVSFVVGQYNDTTCSINGATSWNLGDPLFVVGNGSSGNTRSNAFTVYKDGRTVINGLLEPNEISTNFLFSSTAIIMDMQLGGMLTMPFAYFNMVGVESRDLYVDSGGQLGYISSSRRYKDDIRYMEDIDWLFRLRPVNFTYKTDPDSRIQYGLIAEEVEEIKPELVSYNQEGLPETVSYSKLVVPLLKAIQEQEVKISSQQEELQEKDAEIEDLKARIERIEEALEMQ